MIFMETFILLFALGATLLMALIIMILIVASEVAERKSRKEYEERILNTEKTKRRLY